MFSAKFFEKVARHITYYHDFSRDYGYPYRQTSKILSYGIYSEKKNAHTKACTNLAKSLKIIGSSERTLNIKKINGKNYLPLESVKWSFFPVVLMSVSS